jgi:hypothetical protein
MEQAPVRIANMAIKQSTFFKKIPPFHFNFKENKIREIGDI